MALGTPTGIGSGSDTGKTGDSTLVTSTTVPPGSTVVVTTGGSILDNISNKIVDDSGLGVVWRAIRLIRPTGGTPANTCMFVGWCPNGLPSGTTLTISFAVPGTSSTRLYHALYFTGQGRADKNSATLATAATWTSLATPNTAFSGEVAIAAACITGARSSTDASTPAMTELFDTNASAASGDRALVTQYATGISSGTAVTGSGTIAGGSTPYSAIVVTFREYLTGSSYASEVSADSPSNLWHLDESSGATATDSAGASNGTYVNTPTYSDPAPFPAAGTAITTKSASSEEVTLPVTFSSTSSVEFWVKWPSVVQVLTRDATTTGGTIIALPSGNDVVIRVAGSTVGSFAASHFKDGQWHHLVVTRNGAAVAVYLDGQLVLSGTSATTTTVSPFHLAKNGNNANFEDASFDEVAKYTTTLSWDRVTAHYDAAFATRIFAIAQATEADSAQAITPRKTVTIGRASEVDSARPVTTPTGQTVVIGQATETDLARPIARHAGRAIETDTARPIAVSRHRTIAFSQAIETDAAGEIRPRGVNKATETDSATEIVAVSGFIVQVAQAVETDTAPPLNKLVLIGQALESNDAVHVAQTIPGMAVEHDTARVITPLRVQSMFPDFWDEEPSMVFSPELRQAQPLSPDVGPTLTPTVFQPALIAGTFLIPDTGPTLTPTVFEPTLTQGQQLTPTLVTKAPTVVFNPALAHAQPLSPDVGPTPTSTVYAPALIRGQLLSPDVGPTLTPEVFEPELAHAQAISPDVGPSLGSTTVFAPSMTFSQWLYVGAPNSAGTPVVFEPSLEHRVAPVIEIDEHSERSHRGAIRTAR